MLKFVPSKNPTNPTPIFPQDQKIYQSAGVESSDPSKSDFNFDASPKVISWPKRMQAQSWAEMEPWLQAMPRFSYQWGCFRFHPRSLFTFQRLMNFMCHFRKNCYPGCHKHLVSSVPAVGFIPAPTEPRINGTVVSVNENQHRIRRRRQKGHSGCGVGVPSVPCLWS